MDAARFTVACRRIHRALDLDDLVEAILAALVELLQPPACALIVDAAVHLGPGFEGLKVVPQPGADPGASLQTLWRERGIQEVRRYALSCGDSPVGAVILGWTEPPADFPLLDCLLDQAAFALGHARARRDADQLVAQLFSLHSASLAQSEVVEFASTALLALAEAEQVAIFLLEKDRLSLKSARGFPFASLDYSLHQGPLWRAAAGTILSSTELSPEERDRLPTELQSALQLPLMMDDCLLGVALVQGGSTLGPSRRSLLRTVAVHIASALKNARLYEEANHQAITDGLTDLYNHRYFQDALQHYVNNYRRYQRPFTLLVLDVDGFKAINDNHGHLMGDEILRQLALTLQKTLRVTDIIARYGGDEMAILLPETPLDRGLLVAERLVQRVHGLPFSFPVTVSIGVASCPEHGERAEELLDGADRGLYQAKKEGRDRVGVIPSDATGQGSRHLLG